MPAVSKLTLHQRLIQFHEQVGTIRKTETNPHFRSKFADVNTILKVVMPVLTSVGVVVIQEPQMTEAGGSYLVTSLVNADDRADSTTSKIPLMLKDKTNPQQLGSALTYARRYALVSMLLLESEDDDAEYATNGNNQQYSQQRR